MARIAPAISASLTVTDLDDRPVATHSVPADPGGRIAVPVVTLHAIDDPVAFVELESTFAETMARAGSSGRLVQAFTDDHEHSYLSDAQYVAAVQALLAWVEHGDKPTPAALAERCAQLEAAWGAGCRYRPAYHPQPLASRVSPR